jgi:hypothetical protein
MQGVFDVARHGDVHVVLGVVPVDSESAIEFAGQAGQDLVERSEGIDKVLGIFAADIFYAKIVDN